MNVPCTFFPLFQICEVSLNDLAPITNHDLVGGSYRLSFHQRWLVSCGRDGKLLLRLVESPVSDLIVLLLMFNRLESARPVGLEV